LRYALATIGLHDLAVLSLENLNRGAAALEAADAQAAIWIADEVSRRRRRSLLPPWGR
jgi:hypothetical protein